MALLGTLKFVPVYGENIGSYSNENLALMIYHNLRYYLPHLESEFVQLVH
jgi:hypothetical protein